MQLGDFLNGSLSPSPTEPVEFRVVWKDDRGSQTTGRASAVLAFVDAHDVADAQRAAKAAAQTAGGDEREEFVYHLLVAALRDSDDPRKPFCPTVPQLRKALLPPVAGDLMTKYNLFVKREFPSVLSERDREQLAEEARKNS